MNELVTFIQLGFRHIVDAGALDHMLFLVALAAIYRVRDWRDILWVISAFTIGHSITLALAATGILRIPAPIVEFLIPITIAATCVENMIVREHNAIIWRGRYRPVFAGVFGIVHGAGFATYLQNIFMDHIVVPLFGFNIGIELGQVVVLAVAFSALALCDRTIIAIRAASSRSPSRTQWSPVRVRSLALSAVIFVIAAHWAIQRAPW